MSTQILEAQSSTPANDSNAHRGRHRKPARGRGGNPKPAITQIAQAVDEPQVTNVQVQERVVEAQGDTEDPDVCIICAEPFKYYAMGLCNHRTCHVCALRLRALYKKQECSLCKTELPMIIYTVSPDADFLSYTPDMIQFKDTKLNIYFETEEMMEETLILLRFNCPDASCSYIGTGWSDLKLHARASHGRTMCDLCTRFGKAFSHEHILYTQSMLHYHLPSLPHRAQKPLPADKVEGGIHPMCNFCRECFVGDDELFSHMRERHEECFLCKRDGIRDLHFADYELLEAHFKGAHHMCPQPSCLAQKFVVFSTAIDLKAHLVQAHGSEMKSRDKRDARRVEAGFEFEDLGGRRLAGSSANHNARRGEREPPPHASSSSLGGRQGGNRRRQNFGATLTAESDVNRGRQRTPSPPPDDPVLAERQAALTERLQALAEHPVSALTVVKATIQGYRRSESTARDVISTIWTVLDSKIDETASIVNLVVDLIEDEEKKELLLSSWNDFKIEQRRQFPDLVPAASVGVENSNGRVLTAKHVTTNTNQSMGVVWDRVAQAASSGPLIQPIRTRPGERFPTLQTSALAGPSFRPATVARTSTPWLANNRGPPPEPPRTLNTQYQSVVVQPRPPAPPTVAQTASGKYSKLTGAAFPALPTANARAKPSVSGNKSLRNIMGNTQPINPAWGTASGTSAAPEDDAVEATETQPSKGKKAKGKQKQTLFTLGSFPT